MSSATFQKIADVQMADVAKAWDDMALARYDAIANGQDQSYTQVLLPLIDDFASKTGGSRLIDAGCGLGFGAKAAAQHFDIVHGVDPSTRSIEIAKAQNAAPNIQYWSMAVEKFARGHGGYDALVSNMVLMDCSDLAAYLTACHDLVRPGGHMMFTFCHPSFWPRYWGFDEMTWFDYGSEIAIQANYRTSSTGLSASNTIYFHRPLSTYLNEMKRLGVRSFHIREILGRAVTSETLNRYPRYITLDVEK